MSLSFVFRSISVGRLVSISILRRELASSMRSIALLGGELPKRWGPRGFATAIGALCGDADAVVDLVSFFRIPRRIAIVSSSDWLAATVTGWESPLEGRVLLDMLAVFVERCRADDNGVRRVRGRV